MHWYKWKYKDFDESTEFWSYHQASLYRALLDVHLKKGFIPTSDTKSLAAFLRVEHEYFMSHYEGDVASKFFEKDGKLFNAKAAAHFQGQTNWKQSQSTIGRVGAAKKYLCKQFQELDSEAAGKEIEGFFGEYDERIIEAMDKGTLRDTLKGYLFKALRVEQAKTVSSVSSSVSVSSSSSFEKEGAGRKNFIPEFGHPTEKIEICERVIKHFNDRTDSATPVTHQSYQVLIGKILDDGFTEEDMKDVIDLKVMESQKTDNRGDPLFKPEWVKPKTLFEMQKFLGYVEDAKKWRSGKVRRFASESTKSRNKGSLASLTVKIHD